MADKSILTKKCLIILLFYLLSACQTRSYDERLQTASLREAQVTAEKEREARQQHTEDSFLVILIKGLFN